MSEEIIVQRCPDCDGVPTFFTYEDDGRMLVAFSHSCKPLVHTNTTDDKLERNEARQLIGRRFKSFDEAIHSWNDAMVRQNAVRASRTCVCRRGKPLSDYEKAVHSTYQNLPLELGGMMLTITSQGG